MELFFMMTAMLALLGPIAVGRVRCMRIAPRFLACLASVLLSRSRARFDAGVFAGQIFPATLHRLRRHAGVRSTMRTASGGLARRRWFDRGLLPI